MAFSRAMPFVRFLRQAETHGLSEDACWTWAGITNSNGYGRFSLKDNHRLAHRVAYELFVGPIPDGKNVCHSCDNRLCVNPHHLWLGSQSENLQDAVAKGRMVHPNTRGERNGNGKLKQADVDLIRAMFAGGQKKYRIAERFGVSPTTIADIIGGKTWRKVA